MKLVLYKNMSDSFKDSFTKFLNFFKELIQTKTSENLNQEKIATEVSQAKMSNSENKNSYSDLLEDSEYSRGKSM